MCDQGSVEDARARVRAAKAREIEAHRRAIKMHEDAVILFDRFHQTGKSLRARERVERARELLRQALAEQGKLGNRFERNRLRPVAEEAPGVVPEPPLR